MTTVEEIKLALRRMSSDDHRELLSWLEQLTDYRHSGVREPRPAYGPYDGAFFTLEEFLELTEADPHRYEFVNGIIRAMAGTSVSHGRIQGELFGIVRQHLRG